MDHTSISPPEGNRPENRTAEITDGLRLVFDLSPDPICFKDAAGRWMEANEAALRLFGLAGVDYQGKTGPELCAHSPTYKQVYSSIEAAEAAAWTTRKLVRSEEIIPLASSGQIVLDMYKIPLFHPDGSRKGMLAMGRDITARKRAEDELQRSHDLLEHLVKAGSEELESANTSLRALGDNLPDVAIYQFERSGDDDGRYTYVSRGFERIRGVSLTDLVRQGKILELMHPEDIPLFRQTEKESAENLTVYDFEGRVVMPSGDLKWVRWRAAPRHLANGNILWEGFMTDVTKRKRAEQALHEAHQALLVIKECGEAIARATDESELLRNVCRTVLKIDNTRLAWIGFPEEDANKTIRMVAHAGADLDYIKKLRICWSDKPLGQGPGGTAVREGRTVVFGDLATDPRFAIWREEALQRGYACIISLPLVAKNSCIGVLSIYSSQPHAFGAEKLELLEQLAGDIAHGMTGLRAQAERGRLEKELLNISEREKQTIAQELHDGLCQHLAGAALMGSLLQRRLSAQGNSEADYAGEICALLATGLAEARNISHGLHPIKSASDGLMESLAQLAKTATRLFNTDCSFVFDEEAIIKDPESVTHLFRIAQEALTNAMKHGEATRVILALRKGRGSIILSIEDNGLGIPKDVSRSRGLGLQLMSHRARSIGATLEIRRRGKTGTVVSCELPLPAEPEPA